MAHTQRREPAATAVVKQSATSRNPLPGSPNGRQASPDTSSYRKLAHNHGRAVGTPWAKVTSRQMQDALLLVAPTVAIRFPEPPFGWLRGSCRHAPVFRP